MASLHELIYGRKENEEPALPETEADDFTPAVKQQQEQASVATHQSKSPRGNKRPRADTTVGVQQQQQQQQQQQRPQQQQQQQQQERQEQQQHQLQQNQPAPPEYYDNEFADDGSPEKEELARFDLLYAQPDAVGSSSWPIHRIDQIPIVYPAAKVRKVKSTNAIRRARIIEYEKMRQRRKKRKYDYRNEPDLGGALQQQVLNATNAKRTKKLAKANAEKMQVPAIKLESDDDDSDFGGGAGGGGSDQEQEDILSQLQVPLQQQQTQESPEKETTYAETMSAWEYGAYVEIEEIPAALDLPAKLTKIQRKQALEAAKIASLTSKVFSPRSFAKKKARHVPTSKAAFPIRDDPQGYCTGFAQRRQILRASARHIVGTGSSNNNSTDGGALDDSCISALWKLSSRRIFSNDKQQVPPWSLDIILANHHCRGSGQAHIAFGTYIWKDRQAAARALGIGSSLNMTFVGQTMSLARDTKRCNDKELKKIVDEYSSGKVQKYNKRQPPKGVPLVEPTTSYLFHPGTVPPTPVLPLDCGGIVFGPTDRFEHANPIGIVDESVYKLTIASLVARIMATNVNDDDKSVLQTQLFSVVQQIVKVNQSEWYKRLREMYQMTELEIPLTCFYKSVMSYCGLVANGMPLPLEGDDCSDGTDLSLIADHLLEFLDVHIDHNGLKMFTRVHIMFGLLRICKMLPESGIDILSRPLDTVERRTPFEVMRLLLTHLEESDVLVDTGTTNADKTFVNVGELEYALYRGGDIFAKCVEREPTEVDYHCWYIATLCASLLLCSGNRIDSGAHKYPSAYTGSGSAEQNLFRRGSAQAFHLGTQHEIRKMLPKFNELRMQTAVAFQSLAHLAKHQKGSRAHSAVSSFLEWGQPIALMLGPLAMDDCYRDVRLYHSYHLGQWAVQEGTMSALHTVLVQDDGNLDKRLAALACALERNPGNISHWSELARALGPIGRRPASGDCCAQPECRECANIVKGLSIDHVGLKHRCEAGCWWGAGRCDWWYESLLQTSDFTPVADDFFEGKAETIQGMLEDALGSVQPVELAAPLSATNEGSDGSLDWLDEFINRSLESDDEEKVPSRESRSETVDEYLPATFVEQSESTCQNELELPVLSLSGKDGSHFELVAFKILILCHLNSVSHEGVNRAILRLVQKCWSDTGLVLEGNAFRCLRWLRKTGLDIALIVRRQATASPDGVSNILARSIPGLRRSSRGRKMVA